MRISEVDIPVYERLRQKIYSDLEPETAMQEIACKTVVTCSWRHISALRYESRQISLMLEDHPTEKTGEEEEPINPFNVRWFLSSRQDLGNAIRFLSYLEGKLDDSWYLPEEDKQVLARLFGPKFVDDLEIWKPVLSKDAMLHAIHIARRQETFGDLRKDASKPITGPRDPAESGPKIIRDPNQSAEMQLKLISEQRGFLEDLVRFTREGWPRETQLSSTEFNPRFFATATKDLQRALAWFHELKEKGI